MFKAFKECDEANENRQIPLASNPLASNAVTNDTDNLDSNTRGFKKMLVENIDFEAIKEVDEHNESYDARKQFEELDNVSKPPKVNLQKRVVSDGDYEYDLEYGRKHDQHEFDDDRLEDEYKHEDTHEDDGDDCNDSNMLFVEQKLCAVCNIEQPLRSKHCRSCRK
jgi:hypothetical protein